MLHYQNLLDFHTYYQFTNLVILQAHIDQHHSGVNSTLTVIRCNVTGYHQADNVYGQYSENVSPAGKLLESHTPFQILHLF